MRESLQKRCDAQIRNEAALKIELKPKEED